MPALKKMLQSYDSDLLDRISQFWGVDAINLDTTAKVSLIYDAMIDPVSEKEIFASLPASAKEAWDSIIRNHAKIEWAVFSRKYGEIREFGPAKRERETPDLHPVSISELLWYHGMIGRAFLNLPPEPREYAFIPDELIHLAGDQIDLSKPEITVQSVASAEISKSFPAADYILDYMTDWLAARRMEQTLPPEAWQAWKLPEPFLVQIAAESGLCDKNSLPDSEALKTFFQTSRDKVLLEWFNLWNNSQDLNDLRMLPGLTFEGGWKNDPLPPRALIVDYLQRLERTVWYSLPSLISNIKNRQPDFQRSAGDYDSWFIRKTGSDEFLRGFEHWDEVEGALIYFIITGPLHWLGLVDLAAEARSQKLKAFRLSERFDSFISGSTAVKKQEMAPIKLSSEPAFSVPVSASRLIRYQLGRFCEASAFTAVETRYTFTPSSLLRAQNQGLTLTQLIHFFEKNKISPLPKTLLLLAENWDKHGLESKIESAVLLRTTRPETLQQLQQNHYASKYILEILTPTTALIQKNGVSAVKKALLESGILTQVELDV